MSTRCTTSVRGDDATPLGDPSPLPVAATPQPLALRPPVQQPRTGGLSAEKNAWKAAAALAQASIDRWIDDHAEPSAAEPSSSASPEALGAVIAALAAWETHRAAAGDSRLPEEEADAPLQLGRFQLRNECGRGGFGIVYRAFDPLLQRDVALKIPRFDRLSTGWNPEHFVHEAQIAAQLNHPHILKVHEARRFGPVWYIASAYCEGPTLGAWLRRRGRPLAPRVAARLIADAARAVHYAHQRGVLHLDLKPDNLLLEGLDDAARNDASSTSDALEGQIRPLIADFGLARRTAAVDAADEGRICGTQAYMAPEQLRGERDAIGVGADVYGLGAILHEALGGRLAPRTASPAGAPDASHSRGLADAAPTERLPLQGAPADLAAICRMCLAADPESRYATAAELADDLQRFVRDEPVRARSAPPLERLLRWGRRRPGIALLSAALLFSVVASLAALSVLWRRAEHRLAAFQGEQRSHAATSDKMQRSVLNLAWTLLENRLLADRYDDVERQQFALLDGFLQDLDGWSLQENAHSQTLAALRAAQHSLALADDTRALSELQVRERFLAGLAAWRELAARNPDHTAWPRAQCLHVLTYADRTAEDRARADWLWWRGAGGHWLGAERAAIEGLAPLTAELLVELAARREALGQLRVAAGMYAAALGASDRRDQFAPASQPDLVVMEALRGQLRMARLLDDQAALQAAIATVDRLRAELPDVAECHPETAWAVGLLLSSENYIDQRAQTERDAVALRSASIPYLQRGVGPSRLHVDRVLALANVQRNLAGQLIRQGDATDGRNMLEQALLTLAWEDLPDHRDVALLRGRLHFLLADERRKADDFLAALEHLRAGLNHVEEVTLRNRDPMTVWAPVLYAWSTRANLCLEHDLHNECRASIERCQQLLAQLGPGRRKHRDTREVAARLQRTAERLNVAEVARGIAAGTPRPAG